MSAENKSKVDSTIVWFAIGVAAIGWLGFCLAVQAFKDQNESSKAYENWGCFGQTGSVKRKWTSCLAMVKESGLRTVFS